MVGRPGTNMPRKPNPRNTDPEIIRSGLSMIQFELVRIIRHKDKYGKVSFLVNQGIWNDGRICEFVNWSIRKLVGVSVEM